MEENREEKNKLYVGNLPYTIDDDALFALFRDIEGVEVTEARVISDKFSGRSKGFGFVTVANDEMAQTAITALNGKEIEGRTIFVNIAKPMVKRDDNRGGAPRSGGYGRSYR